MNVELKQYGSKKILFPVRTLREASQAVRYFIERQGLGSRDWDGGWVRDGGKKIAHVSYNGRVWLPKKELDFDADEITGEELDRVR